MMLLLLLLLASAPCGADRTLKVKAIAYCQCGTTATGARAGHGSIAVDPKVIPLGSTIYVPGYGHGKAVDTGRLIRGCRIDVWIPSRSACLRGGVSEMSESAISRHRNKAGVRCV